ncbi:MFS transporter [Gallaecimonas mangrovi]|uniref:MFS transporter n=1 Tax=Gallaecimonas mangrovi TaxID=2291597 RepID=UPI000E20C0D7|nr:MFS transporter [Gallaecimonas mangrovi]
MISKSRYLLLGFFMLCAFVLQLQWLSHAAIAQPAADLYQRQIGDSNWLSIDLLALVYMLVYLLLSFPASYVIDRFGLKSALALGAISLLVSAVIKALLGQWLWGLLLGQLGLAIAQPFILNAITTLTMHYFPAKERALAAGLAVFAQYLGMLAAMVLSPLFLSSVGQLSAGHHQQMLWLYAALSIVAGGGLLAVLLFQPQQPMSAFSHSLSFVDGLKLLMKSRDMLLLLALFTIGLGMVNALSSLIDDIARALALKSHGGSLGALMLVGGLAGSLIIPLLSDALGKRKALIVVAMLGVLPAISGLVFIDALFQSPALRLDFSLLFAFGIGFFVLGIGPVGFQYAAERTEPAPESASQGMLLWIGQIAGILMVAVMSVGNGHFLPMMLLGFVGLSLLGLLMSLFLSEVKISTAAQEDNTPVT